MMLAITLSAWSVADARRGEPPRSVSLKVAAMTDVDVLVAGSIDRATALAEDKARVEPGPTRFALPESVSIMPTSHGTWEDLADGGRLWRLQIHAPNATDLNFGFMTYRLPPGATLHIVSEDHDYYQGPFTAEDNKDHGEFWTPVVPGDRAVIELFVPDGVEFEPDLELGTIGRGYRDLFRKDSTTGSRGSCNVNVACPEGDPWRDQIRSVGRYTISGESLCTGTLIMDVPGSFTPNFLSAAHCEVSASNAQTVVVYWNHQSDSCDTYSDPNLNDNQTGSTFRASHGPSDCLLVELDDPPDAGSNVFYAGWDARDRTPSGTTTIHHPSGNEKSISLDDDPPTITSYGEIVSPGDGTHFRVADWDLGTTEGGSSGCCLFDDQTGRCVGTLHGGFAACGNDEPDWYGRLSMQWEGGGTSASRLKDWLDPASSGTLFVNGANSSGGGGGGGSSDCGNAYYDNGTWGGTAWFNGGGAGNPNNIYGVKFELADFGFTPGNTQITGFCAGNHHAWDGGPWPNEVFIYADSGGLPNESAKLGQGTVYTGDGAPGEWYEVNLSSPVTLNGDFWVVMRGDPKWTGEDFNTDFDNAVSSDHSYGSASGIAGLAQSSGGNYMLRAKLQEGGGGGGTGDGAYNYFLAAIAHTPGVGGALWRSKVGVLNRSGSSADVTFTYYWKNGPTTVKTTAVSKSIFNGRLETWDDAAVSLFGITNKSSGSVLINSTKPLVVTARTYNVGEDGSFGSFMPGVTAADGIGAGEVGVLSQLTGNNDFRTNVGLVNLSNKTCQVRVRVINASGGTLGSAVTETLGAHKFTQINNVFGATGSGTRNNAYATVEVLTSGCEVWAYGAVIDGTAAFPGTDDATTVPLAVVTP
jgi:hypothetical protein